MYRYLMQQYAARSCSCITDKILFPSEAPPPLKLGSELINVHAPYCVYYKITFHEGRIHFAGNQIARVAMFLCHTPLR